jgi:uncharacterized protein with PIN domain
MVVDTSALAAILFDEPDAEQFEAAIESDPVRLISAATLVEASLVVDKRFGEVGRTNSTPSFWKQGSKLWRSARNKPTSLVRRFEPTEKAATLPP